MTSGSSPGPRYSALIGICGPALLSFRSTRTGCRQPLSSIHGRFIGAAPRLEELHQLLARAVLVPFAVALDDFEQLVGRFGAIALRVQRGRQIESRLMIERVCGDFLFQFGDRADGLRLFGEIDRGLHGLDRRVVALGFRHHGDGLLGLLDRACRHVAFRQPRECRDIGGVDRQHLGIDLRCGRRHRLPPARPRPPAGFRRCSARPVRPCPWSACR